MKHFKFHLKKLKISRHSTSLTIEGINFELEKGDQSVAILGESGMGKTTIYKSMFTKYISLWEANKPFEFECEHNLHDITINQNTIKNAKLKQTIGFATQIPYFFNSKNARDNIFSPLKWKKIIWSDDQKEKYIEKLNLKDIAEKEVSILSGGQRQLVNIARMLVLNPTVAIIDECFSNMNEKMAHKYMDIIKQLFPDCFFLLTSHRSSDVEYFGCKIINLTHMMYRSGHAY